MNKQERINQALHCLQASRELLEKSIMFPDAKLTEAAQLTAKKAIQNMKIIIKNKKSRQ